MERDKIIQLKILTFYTRRQTVWVEARGNILAAVDRQSQAPQVMQKPWQFACNRARFIWILLTLLSGPESRQGDRSRKLHYASQWKIFQRFLHFSIYAPFFFPVVPSSFAAGALRKRKKAPGPNAVCSLCKHGSKRWRRQRLRQSRHLSAGGTTTTMSLTRTYNPEWAEESTRVG